MFRAKWRLPELQFLQHLHLYKEEIPPSSLKMWGEEHGRFVHIWRWALTSGFCTEAGFGVGAPSTNFGAICTSICVFLPAPTRHQLSVPTWSLQLDVRCANSCLVSIKVSSPQENSSCHTLLEFPTAVYKALLWGTTSIFSLSATNLLNSPVKMTPLPGENAQERAQGEQIILASAQSSSPAVVRFPVSESEVLTIPRL